MQGKKRLTRIIIVLLACFLFAPAVYADGVELEIFLDGEEVYVGEDTTIVIRYRSDQAMGSIDAEISYDHEKIEYRFGGGNIGYLSGGSGGITDVMPMGAENRAYYFTFRALDEGEARISIDFSEVTSYETGMSLGRPKEDFTFAIQPAREKPPEDDNGTGIPPEPIEPPVLDENFIEWEYDGTVYYIYRDGREASLPDGFQYAALDFEGEEVTAGIHERGEVVILYAIPEGGRSRWFIYQEEDLKIIPLREITLDQEYRLLDIEGEIPDFYRITLEVKGFEVEGLRNDGYKEGVYLLYATDRIGTPQHYFYDEHEGTMQRATIVQNEVLSYIDIDGGTDDRGFPLWTIYTIGGITIALLVAIGLVNTGGKKKPPSRRQRRSNHNEKERGV